MNPKDSVDSKKIEGVKLRSCEDGIIGKLKGWAN